MSFVPRDPAASYREGRDGIPGSPRSWILRRTIKAGSCEGTPWLPDDSTYPRTNPPSGLTASPHAPSNTRPGRFHPCPPVAGSRGTALRCPMAALSFIL